LLFLAVTEKLRLFASFLCAGLQRPISLSWLVNILATCANNPQHAQMQRKLHDEAQSRLFRCVCAKQVQRVARRFPDTAKPATDRGADSNCSEEQFQASV
jgi:hypothetical protein